MPIEVDIEPVTGFRTYTVRGAITADEVRSTLEKVYALKDINPGASALWDLREADIKIPTEDARHLSDFVGKLIGEGVGGKAALIVPEDFEFGMARMYETILASQSRKRVKVFRDWGEASSWLDDTD